MIAVVAALVSGCAAEPTPEVTPTPTFTSDSDAFAAAEATYRAYVDALNQVDLADPETFEAVYAWTTGEANAAAREYLSQLHAEGVTLHGESRVSTVSMLPSSRVEVILATCLNVQDIDLRDTDGNSVVDGGRPPEQSFEVSMVRSPAAPHGFLIEAFSGGAKSRCG